MNELNVTMGLSMIPLMDHLFLDKHDLPAEFRELLVSHISNELKCSYMYRLHRDIALQISEKYLHQTIKDCLNGNFSNLSPKLYYLLQVGKACVLDQSFTKDLIIAAKEHEATDIEIHRVIEISSFVSMLCSYFNGLQIMTGKNISYDSSTAESIAKDGYVAVHIMQ